MDIPDNHNHGHQTDGEVYRKIHSNLLSVEDGQKYLTVPKSKNLSPVI
jgi:hypothetical protein